MKLIEQLDKVRTLMGINESFNDRGVNQAPDLRIEDLYVNGLGDIKEKGITGKGVKDLNAKLNNHLSQFKGKPLMGGKFIGVKLDFSNVEKSFGFEVVIPIGRSEIAYNLNKGEWDLLGNYPDMIQEGDKELLTAIIESIKNYR